LRLLCAAVLAFAAADCGGVAGGTATAPSAPGTFRLTDEQLRSLQIERYITVPIEIQMTGIPNVTAIRSISLFGLSDVKLQFTYAFTYEQAEQWVINRLKTLEDWIPERRFKAVPGVIDVTGWGGLTKAYEIDIDQRLLEAHQIALSQLLQALGNSDLNVA
jgi:heavy metal efflux system protein